MLSVTVDRNKISGSLKATVAVTSDVNITAYEARATLIENAYGRGIGYDLLSDDAGTSNGVVTLSSPSASFSFDIEASELSSDGNYRIGVYVKDTNGVWNDCCQLYASGNQTIIDSAGNNVLVKRTGTGTDSSYTSAYSGETINNFIGAVI